jgi:hypothetical protein
MITVAWYDYRPGQVTPERRRAFVAALQKLLPGAPRRIPTTACCATHLGADLYSRAALPGPMQTPASTPPPPPVALHLLLTCSKLAQVPP